MRNPVLRILCGVAGVICAALGIVGMFLPVLPTTPFLLLATFLFARSSSRLNEWLISTRAYRNYVVPFKTNQGIPATTKTRILATSFFVIGISAFAVKDIPVWNFVVWFILELVVLWLLYLMCIRIPTLGATSPREPERDPR